MDRRATANIRLVAEPVYQGWLNDKYKTVADPFPMSFIGELKNGIGAGQCNRAVYFEQTIGMGATVSLDIRAFSNIDVGNGVGKDFFNQSITIHELVFLGILNEGPGKIEVQNSAGDSFQDFGGKTGEGGFLSLYDPSAGGVVIPSGNKLLYIESTGGNTKIRVMVLGRQTS